MTEVAATNSQDTQDQQQPLHTQPAPPFTTMPVTRLPAATDQSRLQRRLAGNVPISDVTIIVGRRNAVGQRTEQMHNIDGRDFRITCFSEVVAEKMQKVKDDNGNLVGFEATGEYELTIKLKYVNE